MRKKQAPTPAEPVRMTRHNVFMPPAQLEGLSRVASAKGGTAAEHLRKAVGTYLKRVDTHR
jgi:hypothetical protein